MKQLNRIREVRAREGKTVRACARMARVSQGEWLELEEPTNNLTISDLHIVQRALDVPIGELLVENFTGLDRLIIERVAVLRAYKSAKSLQAMVKESLPQKRMLERLIDDLLKAFPELDGSTINNNKHHQNHDVHGWPIVGARRTDHLPGDLGRILDNPLPAPDYFDVV